MLLPLPPQPLAQRHAGSRRRQRPAAAHIQACTQDSLAADRRPITWCRSTWFTVVPLQLPTWARRTYTELAEPLTAAKRECRPGEWAAEVLLLQCWSMLPAQLHGAQGTSGWHDRPLEGRLRARASEALPPSPSPPAAFLRTLPPVGTSCRSCGAAPPPGTGNTAAAGSCTAAGVLQVPWPAPPAPTLRTQTCDSQSNELQPCSGG